MHATGVEKLASFSCAAFWSMCHRLKSKLHCFDLLRIC